MKKPATRDDLQNEEWSRYYSKQANDKGGFCARCGEGVRPLLNNDIESFGLCEYNGNHPDCGDHDMELIERTSEVFGSYEIWRCKNDNCDYTESL